LSSKLVGNPGICMGLKTQLEHVDHWRLVTRDEAVRVFSQQSSSPAGITGVDGGTPGAMGGPAGVPEPSLTGEDATAQALEMALLSQVLIYPEGKDDNDDDDNNNNNNKDGKKKKDETVVHQKMIKRVPSRLPEEDLIISQDWDCYGSTELDLLVLRPQGETEEKVVAVAPYCSPGLSMRDVRSELGNDRTLTLRFALVEFDFQSAADEDDDAGNREQATTDNKNTPSSDSKSYNPLSQLLSKPEENRQKSMTSSTSTNKDQTSKESSSSSLSSSAEQFIKVSTKVAQHMQNNAKLVRDAVKEDFSGRTYAAGNRILNEFGTTLDRTVQLMEKVAKTIFGADDDGSDSKKPPGKK
jgi:hypothetical protein